MAWDQLETSKPHIAYAILGGFISLFMLFSLFIKEKLYIGEATIASIVGVIFGPHAANLFSPNTWGNKDYITLELSRIVLIVQVFAVGVELPPKYMWKHWRSVAMMLLPVMTTGWIVTGALIYAMIPSLDFLQSLVVGACVTATDPVLASSVVGNSKFARRVPGHIRNLLSAESGCNDGMAFPFLYLSLYLVLDAEPGKAIQHWFTLTVLYEVVFGCALGAIIGVCGRKLVKSTERHGLVDRESFLALYLAVALFSCGVGVMIGSDDLLVSFSAGAAFAWDGWFTEKTEESHVSNVIDLLLNLSFFVYWGSIIPWDYYNDKQLGLNAWRMVVLAILVLLLRRLPAVMALKVFIPDIRTWREAAFCGHFGPIGVGAIFVSILARAELESETTRPLAELPTDPADEHYVLVQTIWPIVSFLVMSSILVHGSTIAVYTLGKRLQPMSLTMTFTQTQDVDSPNWLQRLPRLELGHSFSARKKDSEPMSEKTGDDSLAGSSGTTEREGGPVDSSAIGSAIRPPEHAVSHQPRQQQQETHPSLAQVQPDSEIRKARREERVNEGRTLYQEGDNVIVENSEGEIIRVKHLGKERMAEAQKMDSNHDFAKKIWSYVSGKKPNQEDQAMSEIPKIAIQRSDSSRSIRDPDAGSTINNDVEKVSSPPETNNESPDDEEETEVEKRRRLAALGVSEEPNPEDKIEPNGRDNEPATASQRTSGETEESKPNEQITQHGSLKFLEPRRDSVPADAESEQDSNAVDESEPARSLSPPTIRFLDTNIASRGRHRRTSSSSRAKGKSRDDSE